MFAYCLNNPPVHYDNQGRDAVRIDLTDADEDGDGIPDEPAGGATGSNGTNGGSSSNGTPSSIQIVAGASGSSPIVVSNPYSEPTEKHHIVERCQEKKSGFSHDMIQDSGNIVDIPYLLHRKISGYYSSKTIESGDLRVRDYIAGKTFTEQWEFGVKVIEKFWEELYGKNKTS